MSSDSGEKTEKATPKRMKELREAMNLALLELADDPGLVGEARVLELAGNRKHRLAQLERAIDGC